MTSILDLAFIFRIFFLALKELFLSFSVARFTIKEKTSDGAKVKLDIILKKLLKTTGYDLKKGDKVQLSMSSNCSYNLKKGSSYVLLKRSSMGSLELANDNEILWDEKEDIIVPASLQNKLIKAIKKQKMKDAKQKRKRNQNKILNKNGRTASKTKRKKNRRKQPNQ